MARILTCNHRDPGFGPELADAPLPEDVVGEAMKTVADRLRFRPPESRAARRDRWAAESAARRAPVGDAGDGKGGHDAEA
jgi:hypothetical protein